MAIAPLSLWNTLWTTLYSHAPQPPWIALSPGQPLSPRDTYPAAVQKDKHSRSGLTKTELAHKSGAGRHNWGSLRTKGDDESTGRQDGDLEVLDEPIPDEATDIFVFESEGDEFPVGRNLASDAGNDFKGLNIQQRDAKFESQGVATSPTESTGSLDSVDRPDLGRRGSSVTDQEREKARHFREGVLHKKAGRGIDLADIAKTSYGIAQSPPTNSYIGTSPSNGFHLSK
ncbi:hypothetical protein L198_07672 [Cryptococcus wingfieldii CBS 7118]|uniref:Hyaluronan/mRNA-binding protein domain-containing protein n=1 Tax=Cryptococcus wingfieldii CBS 7118 TaxID=1295528 RepID=A0A1E3I7G4_9TREE|nr:hypothetical protein L198_07672 [Cryptococcus wingfieldii CBS 7118]ODN83776.1 hypothetical protein L198_07672 [Cryptococcus wingfieldii CBS 7118]